jgi:non-ribosomal peptide synthetase component F
MLADAVCSQLPLPPLCSAALMDATERDLVLRGFNQAACRPYNSTLHVHARFAMAAATAPDAPCVMYSGATYSYREVCRIEQSNFKFTH